MDKALQDREVLMASQGVDSYTAANEYTEDTTVSNETIESTGTDENAAPAASVVTLPSFT